MKQKLYTWYLLVTFCGIFLTWVLKGKLWIPTAVYEEIHYIFMATGLLVGFWIAAYETVVDGRSQQNKNQRQ